MAAAAALFNKVKLYTGRSYFLWKPVMQSEEKGDMMNTDRGQELMQRLHHC